LRWVSALFIVGRRHAPRVRQDSETAARRGRQGRSP
jgi:hypothetical protein